MSGPDLDRLVAIDVHVHVEADGHGHYALDDELRAAASKYFKGDPYHPTVPQIAADYRKLSMAAVIFTVDAEAATGQQLLSNEEIAEAAAEHPDILIPFGSIDPARGAAGVRAARRLVEQHGVRGFKFHPSLQAFEPNDRKHYPLYEELQTLGVPALFHTGQTGIGSGLPGGRGIKLRYSDPMLLDDVAADFPDLTIIMAPLRALAGLRDRGRPAQGERLHRPVRLVAAVLPASAGACRQRAAQAQGALRLRLPGANAGALAARLCRRSIQRRGPAEDSDRKCPPTADSLNLDGSAAATI